MATATTMTTFDDALKQYYTADAVKDLTYPNHPFLAMVPKNEKFKGKNLPVPVIYGHGQGRSSTFSTAQSNASASSLAEFLLTRKKDYGVVTIGGEVLEASRGDEYAFLSASTSEINGTLRALSDSLSKSLFGDGSGSIGKVNNASGAFGVATLDLVDDNDVVNFEKNQKVSVHNLTTGTAVRSGTLQVSAIDRNATTMQVTMTGNLSAGISAIANNDYVFMEGDKGNKVTGLAGWLPTTAPTSGDSFFGLDRSSDATRLGGQRYNGGSLASVDLAIINASVRLGREGGKPDYCFVSFTDFGSLITTLNSQVQRDVAQVGKFSFQGVEMYAPTGIIKIIPDKDCPVSRAFLVQMDTWKLYSIGATPRILRHDGLEMLRQSSDDGVEIRAGYYAQLGCTAPGWNCNITLP